MFENGILSKFMDPNTFSRLITIKFYFNTFRIFETMIYKDKHEQIK